MYINIPLLYTSIRTHVTVVLFSCHSSQNNHFAILYEPMHEKTNNLVSDQVRHKPACTVTEAD